MIPILPAFLKRIRAIWSILCNPRLQNELLRLQESSEVEKITTNGINSGKTISEQKEGISIHPNVIVYLSEKLSNWESQKGYLSKDVTLQSLSKTLGTNCTYLSKLVNTEKGMNFSNYINTLRVEYILRRIHTHPVYLKYSVKAIAHEGGFKSSECFSKTFQKKYGVYPSEYLKELRSS